MFLIQLQYYNILNIKKIKVTYFTTARNDIYGILTNIFLLKTICN